jgi:hypothetical protein
MRHLNEEELLDLAEGARSEDLAPHLSSCAACRRQIAELRAVLLDARGVKVPEPSPLFWDHLSARVRDEVAAVRAGRAGRKEEPGRSSGWTLSWMSWKLVASTATLAAVAVAGIIALRGPSPATPAPDGSTSGAPIAIEASAAEDLTPLADDPSLSLIGDLAGDLDWELAIEAGLTTGTGPVERLLFEMSVDERLELQRILQQELAARSRQGVS